VSSPISTGLLSVVVSLACERGEPLDSKLAPVAPPPEVAAAHADEPEHEELPTRVRLDPAVIAQAKIETAPVAREVLVSTIDLPGEIASDPDQTARVSVLVPGRIEAVRFKEGQRVRKGEVLVILKVPELGKAKAAFAATSAKAAVARRNADRLQALAEKRLAASQEVLAARAEAEALDAEAQAAAEQLTAWGTDSTGAVPSQLALRAPLSGVVVARDAMVGQVVVGDQTLATIADLSEVWFLGRVFEKNLAEVRLGAPAEVELNAYPKERFTGSIEYLGKQIDPSARTIVARIALGNRADLLRLGLFGVARVASGPESKAPVLVVPRSAVTEVGQKPVVFVRQPDGDFDLHQVVLGAGALGKVEIVSGLREGEQVVVQGVFTLKSVVLKNTFGEEE
jgi:cobalt-zinc-cadmium efflux system membrane fusion protein